MKQFLVGLFLASLTAILSEVTVLKSVQILYDKSPKLRIRGSGFDADDHDIILELGATGQTPLKVDKDYLISKDADGDGIILKLLGNRKWANLQGKNPPVGLVLSSVYFGADSEKNLLADPVIIANVLNTPSVEEGDAVIYSSATNELRINGTGFIGAKKVDLYFDPPLVKEVAYEDVTKYPLQRDQVVLRLRHNYNWRDDEGPLNIMGVDTGAGPVKLGEDGVHIGDVVMNLEAHGVTVEPTADEQLVYNDERQIVISGTGFNTIGNTLRFANGLLGKANYTIVQTSDTSLTLRIVAGSYWRKNAENLPGALTLLAVNTGEGFVAVGPNNAGKGRDVAMVFERPNVFSSNTKLFRTHSHELHIKGEGFHDEEEYKIALKFEPALVAGEDYSIKTISRTELEVTLLDGRAWRESPGPLQLVAINTRGDDAGWVKLSGEGVHVAEVVENLDGPSTNGVEVFPMGVKVYQSVLNQKIQITGTGFKEGMEFTFEPAMELGKDYEMSVQGKNQATLTLKSGKKWRADAGFIIAKSIKIDKKEYNLAGTEGIRVAIVLADPVITPSKDTYHESQSKLVVISGTGFTNVADTKIMIRPSAPASYKVLGVLEDALRIQLKPDQDWLPGYLSLNGEKDDGKKVTLQVASIDTGAGVIAYDEPITIGYVVKDREGVVCDDSCEFAFDGVCDDGTEPNDQYYYQNYNNYMDDDLGGFYGDAEYGGEDGEGGEGEAYGVAYDDYYMENEDYAVSACVEGTDCTDCGGVDAIIDYTKPLDPESGISSCTNTCIYPRDGVCDDPRGTKYCELGTDCQDCGPVGSDNFTRSDDDGWWDDDDDYWTFNDPTFTAQADGLEANRHKVKVFHREESNESMPMLILEGFIYTLGAIFLAAGLYFLNRWYKGQTVPCMPDFDKDGDAQRQFELQKVKRMPLTPDVIRT